MNMGMEKGDPRFTRREALGGGILALVGLALPGCQAGGRNASLPGPIWPDEAGVPRPATPLPSVGAPVTNAAPLTGVIPRSAWTSTQAVASRTYPMNGVSRITVHHSAIDSSGLRSRDTVARAIASIRAEHVSRRDPRTGKPWADIGYHFIIDPQGNIWEGRPVALQGAHVADTNEHNLGIMLLGNFDQQAPTPASVEALDRFVAFQMRRFGVGASRLYTHQELARTACPGRNLQRHMLAARARGGRLALG